MFDYRTERAMVSAEARWLAEPDEPETGCPMPLPCCAFCKLRHHCPDPDTREDYDWTHKGE